MEYVLWLSHTSRLLGCDDYAAYKPKLPTDAPAVPPAIAWSPGSPHVPIPSAIRIQLRIQRLLIREMPLLLIALALIVGLLRSYVEAAADELR